MVRWCLAWFGCLWFLGVGLIYAQAPKTNLKSPPLYQKIDGGYEEYQVQKGDRLPRIALKKGVRWRVLAKKNNLKNPDKLTPGSFLKIKNTFIIPTEVDHGLVVNLAELKVYHFEHGSFKKRYPIAAGRPTWETPTGKYKILNKVKNPTWTVPPSIQEEMEEMGVEVLTKVPPGPKNPLGAYWMATSAPGVGIHATTRPWSIGHYASHGCLRMLPEEIEELFPQVEVGMPVHIIYRPLKLAITPDQRVMLEAHLDIYDNISDMQAAAEQLIRSHNLDNLVDWKRVKSVVRNREGVAEDVTRDPDTIIGQTLLPPEPRKSSRPAPKPAVIINQVSF